MVLKNKNILLGVTGSISVYKAIELTRLYVKAGANVKIIMTDSAKKFVTPLTFETISRNYILDNDNEDWSTHTKDNHINIGKWADIFVIAPATANTINKLAFGIADNILTQTALAYNGIKLIAPAANTNMLKASTTQESLSLLKKANYKFVETISKELACQDVGDGALADIDMIYHRTIRELYKDDYWINRQVVINGGASIEKIDDVRFISNFSSGKMASALALALYYKGADINFIRFSNFEFKYHSFINNIKVEDTKESFGITHKLLIESKSALKKPYFFGVAAISDYIVDKPFKGKLKKTSLGEKWNIELTQNIDILDSIKDYPIYKIGFKAESDVKNAEQNAKNALVDKKLDAICLNNIVQNNFGSQTTAITLITNNNIISLERDDKLNISLNLLNQFKELYNVK